MKLLFISLFVSLVSVLSASAVIGVVQKVDGSVKVKAEGSFKKTKIKVGYEIKSGDLITTSKKSTAVLKLVDSSAVILDKSSTIYFKTDTLAEQTEGKIFYKITSRDAKNSLKIKTPFAIIGIKGTTFIVDAKENGSVKLQEGLIGVQSIKEEFELYRKSVQEQFNNFVKEQQSGFEEFKQAQNRGFAEMTKEFDLEAGNTISFDGNKVDEKAWSKDDDAEFERFKMMMNPKMMKH